MIDAHEGPATLWMRLSVHSATEGEPWRSRRSTVLLENRACPGKAHAHKRRRTANFRRGHLARYRSSEVSARVSLVCGRKGMRLKMPGLGNGIDKKQHDGQLEQGSTTSSCIELPRVIVNHAIMMFSAFRDLR